MYLLIFFTGPSHVNPSASPMYRRRPLDSSDSDNDDTAPAVNTFGRLPDSTPPLPHWMLPIEPLPPSVMPIATPTQQNSSQSEDDESPRVKRRRKTETKKSKRRAARRRAAAQFFDIEARVDGDASADEEDGQPNEADLAFIAPDDCFD